MKNKILFFGTLCVVLALGLVVSACEEFVDPAIPQVAAKFDRVIGAPPATAQDLTNPVFIVSWKAIEEAGSYQILLQAPAEKSSWEIIVISTDTIGGGSSTVPAPKTIYKAGNAEGVTPGTPVADSTDATSNDWAAIININELIDENLGVEFAEGAVARIGVMAIPYKGEKAPSIMWSDFVKFINVTP